MMQFVLGLIKAGMIANYFPTNVIKGMLTAIGIIIILKQIPHALGFDSDAEGDMGFIQPDGDNTFTAIWHTLSGYVHPGATLVTLLSIGIMLAWERPFIKKSRIAMVPGALVAVVTAIGLNELFKYAGGPMAIQPSHLVNIPIAGNMSAFIGQFTLPDFSQWQNPQVYTVALTLCAVASIETMLSLEAVDRIDPLKRRSNPNRELRAQGIGNFIAGMLGGLPITSVIVRSSANVNASARSKASAIFHGLLLLVCVALIPKVLNMIPLSVLAAILLLTGYKLAKISIFKEMYSNGKYQWWPFVITVVAVVFTDLLTGVMIGLAASVISILRGNMKNAYYFHKEEYHEGDLINIQLSQEVSFLNKASIKLTLEHLPDNAMVLIDATDTSYIDHDVLETIREFRDIHAPDRGIKLTLRGFRDKYNLDEVDFVHVETPRKEEKVVKQEN
jgi:MFS superfamily sulfate permease-like transporter